MMCLLCGKDFVFRFNKKFCCYACKDRFYSLKNCKELHRLSVDDKLLRDRIIS